MTPELEEIYQRISDHIVDSAGEQWTKAWIYAEIEEDYAHYECRYLKADDTEPQSFRAGPLKKTLRRLWSIFKDDKGTSWASMTFTLMPSGEFDVDLTYKESSVQ